MGGKADIAHGLSNDGTSETGWTDRRSLNQIGQRGPLHLFAFLEEDIGSDYEVLTAGRVVGRGRVDAGGVERPARDGAVGDGIVALEHRDLGGLLVGNPVPLVVGAIGEAGGLADAVIVDAIVGDVGLVGERGPGTEHEGVLAHALGRMARRVHRRYPPMSVMGHKQTFRDYLQNVCFRG